MKKFLSGILFAILVVTSAFAGINPNQLQDYHNIFTGTNVIVNGGLEISQVLGTASGVPATGSYPVDNVRIESSASSVFSTVQVNSTNVATYTTGYLASLGATNALRVAVNATHGAPAATDEFALYFAIEGLNFSRFQYGTANARTGSLQFKERCSVSGTYSGAIKNYANTRSYPFSFSCTADTDTQVFIQNIPGDTGGTWVGNTNAGAAYVTFDLGSGANLLTTAGTWQTGNYNGVTGQTALSAQINGSTLTITDVQFEVGTFSTAFERKLYDQVLRECKRYKPSFNGGQYLGSFWASSTTVVNNGVFFDTPARIAPTGVILGTGVSLVANGPSGNIAISGVSAFTGSINGAVINWVSGALTLYSSGNIVNAGIPVIIYFTGAEI